MMTTMRRQRGGSKHVDQARSKQHGCKAMRVSLNAVRAPVSVCIARITHARRFGFRGWSLDTVSPGGVSCRLFRGVV